MKVTEAKNHLGERSFQTYAAWKRACKAIDKDVWFDGDADIAQAMVGPKPFKKGETHSIGEWDGAEGCIFKNASKKVSEAKDIDPKAYSKLENKVRGFVSYYKKNCKDCTNAELKRKIKSWLTDHGVEKSLHAEAHDIIMGMIGDEKEMGGIKEGLSLPKLEAYLAGISLETIRESEELKKVASQGDDPKNRRTADKLEIGDVVEITGNVNFKEQTGEITRFGKNKSFVVVRLYNGGEHSFHSSDVSEADLSHEEHHDEDAENHDKFYVAFYDNAEERSWIGVISKEHGGKWHEKAFKGKPELRWGQTYMSYLTPDDIMNWIHKDYHRGIEIEGPFFDASEAEEHVKQNWGRIEESAKPKKKTPASKHKAAVDHAKAHGYDADSYEDQKGGHVTWLGGTVDKKQKKSLANVLGVKEHPHSDKLGYKPGTYFTSREHEVHLDDENPHIRTHKTEASRMGIDEGIAKKDLPKKKVQKARDKIEKTGDYPIKLKEDARKMTPWDVLDALAKKDHGEAGFETLDSDQAAKYVDMAAFDKLADKIHGEFGLLTLDTSAMRKLVNSHPELLSGKAKTVYKNPHLLDEEVYTNYSDWKQSVLLSNPTQAKSIKFRGKMEGEKMTVSAVVPGEDRVYGIWDDVIEAGKVLSEKA